MFYSKKISIYDGSASIQIPAFSKIVNIIPDEYMYIEIIYSLESHHDKLDISKLVSLKIEEGIITEYSSINQLANYFKYWNTYSFPIIELDKVGTHIGINNSRRIIHIFYDEIESVMESRDKKIGNIIN